MAKSKQENCADLYELARDYARAEAELGVQHWVFIEFTKDDDDGNRERIFSYDLPREVYERRRWVVRWREAVLVCRFPRANVSRFYSYYDRRLGNDVRLTDDLRRLVAAKAQVTKAQRKLEEYVAWSRANNLFFDEDTDEELARFRTKLVRKIAGVEAAEERMKRKIEEYENTLHAAQKGVV